jgi:hypothetical protein
MKSIFSRGFSVMFVVLLSFSSLAVLNVKAQEQLPTLKINLISPTNTTYNQNSILLNFSIQKQSYDNMDYTIGYTMQGENTQQQGTFFMGTLSTNLMTFNKNFTEIPDGSYTLSVSAKYVDRIIWVNADKQTVTFTINTKTPTPSPSPTPTLPRGRGPIPAPEQRPTLFEIAIITISLVAVVGLIVNHFKKRRT